MSIRKLFQYTGIILCGSEKNFKKTPDLLKQVSKYSRLTPNFDKTKAIKKGSRPNCKESLGDLLNF